MASIKTIQQPSQTDLLIEEYGPSLEYVPGLSNIVADALSQLDLKPQATLTLKDKY